MITLTDEQRARIDYLLYECEDDVSFVDTLSQFDSSAELHAFAKQFNWDGGCAELEAVLNHPLCDRGTALMVYWLGEPLYFADFSTADDVPDVNRGGYHFVKHVESLLMVDRFQYNSIRFDPMADLNVVQRRRIENHSRIPTALKSANC